MQVYVFGTKKAANIVLQSGQDLNAIEYRMYDERWTMVRSLPDRAVIKFWVKETRDGMPIAKSYGVWNAKKGKVE